MLGQNQSTNLQQEVFILPTGLKEIVRLDNTPLYGSPKLNEKFLYALSKQDKTKNNLKKIETLINKRTIIPCFYEKGILHHIHWRLFGQVGERSIMGFFNPVDGRVVILLSNNANIFSYVSNKFLSVLVAHELSHRAAFLDANKFYQTFRNELIQFYRTLFSLIFKIDTKKLSDSTVFSIVKFLFQYIEMSTEQVSSKALIQYSMLIKDELKSLSSLKHDDFTIIADDYIQLIGIFLKSIDYFFDQMGEYAHILSPIYRAYKKGLSIKNNSTVCIQELIYPSEVIAIMSESGKDYVANKVFSIN